MSKRRTETDQVHSITSTQAPLGEDIDRRARRYLTQMVVRTLCFLGAALSWGRVPTWVSVTLLVGAVVLPYVAVVLANAGRERPDRADSLVGADARLDLRQIGGAPVDAPAVPSPRGRSAGGSGPTGSRAGASGVPGSPGPGRTGPGPTQRRPVPPGPPAWEAERTAAPSGRADEARRD